MMTKELEITELHKAIWSIANLAAYNRGGK